ncbi:MAG: response regulator transcription factor [Solirubrobacteraceae bacterium]
MSTRHLTTRNEPPRHLTLAHGIGDISEIGGGPIRVVVAENSYLIREGLTSMLGAAPEVDLAAVCSSRSELQAAVAAENPDVVLTDIRMSPSGTDEGIRIATRLRETNPETGVVVLTQYAEPSHALGLFEMGAARRAYLLKDRIRKMEELIAAIETVARGGSVIDPLVLDALIQARSRAAHSRLSDLTAREREVLAEIATGKSNGAIAESLFLTKRAVEKHVNSIFSKLDLPESQAASRRVKATLIFLSEDEADATLLKESVRRDTGLRSRPNTSCQALHAASGSLEPARRTVIALPRT